MQINSLSEVLGAVLTYTDLPIESMPVNDNNSVPQLLIQLEKSVSLRIFCANDAVTALESLGDVSPVYYFIVRYPEPVSADTAQYLQPVLDIFNTLLPVGMLETQAHNGLFFRHILLTEEPVLDGLLALDIIQVLRHLLPHIFSWIKRVVVQAELMSTELQTDIKQEFRTLLQLMPAAEPVLKRLPPPSIRNKHYVQQNVIPAFLAGSGALLILVSILMPALSALAILGLLGTVMAYWWRQRYLQFQGGQKEQKELRFFWQLLEVDAVKLAYQGHSLELFQQSVRQKLRDLSTQSVDYPSDILRLRNHILNLKQVQVHLMQRAIRLKNQRQELDFNRANLQVQKNTLMAERSATVSQPLALELENTGFASEDMLMQNLIVTLDYLDFNVRIVSENDVPFILVYVRPGLPPLTIRWMRQWYQAAEQATHSWMLCFDLTLNLSASESVWPRVQELLRMFNRFIPLGALICDHKHDVIVLRYRFVRLRGDLSTMLVMEILEVMASFAERLQQRLIQCRDEKTHLASILSETEQDFQMLQA